MESKSSEDLHSWNLLAFLMANRRPGLPGLDLCGLCGLELAASARRFLWEHKPLGTFGWNKKIVSVDQNPQISLKTNRPTSSSQTCSCL